MANAAAGVAVPNVAVPNVAVPNVAVPNVAVLGDTVEARALRARLTALGVACSIEAGAATAAVVDARHPFATEPLAPPRPGAPPVLRLARPPWRRLAGDDWRFVADAAEAAATLEPAWRRVFLTLGRAALTPFAADPERWWLVRIKGAPGARPPLPRCAVTSAPGPFTAESEAALMRRFDVDALVTRDAGGDGAYPKIAAARALGLPVVMLRRPAIVGPAVSAVEEALAWAMARLGEAGG